MAPTIAESLIGNWRNLLHTLLAGSLTYFGVILWLRLSGKRTLSKWNSFDFVVTIAFGSLLASALLNPTTSFFQATMGVGLLVGLQFVMTWLSVRSDRFQRLLKAKPSLLVFRGQFHAATMRAKRVSKHEVLAAIRLAGFSRVEDIDAVVLETNGEFSVISQLSLDSRLAFPSAMEDVEGFSKAYWPSTATKTQPLT